MHWFERWIFAAPLSVGPALSGVGVTGSPAT
jgi:hypothetical protein